jgi:hypothetical protein
MKLPSLVAGHLMILEGVQLWRGLLVTMLQLRDVWHVEPEGVFSILRLAWWQIDLLAWAEAAAVTASWFSTLCVTHHQSCPGADLIGGLGVRAAVVLRAVDTGRAGRPTLEPRVEAASELQAR